MSIIRKTETGQTVQTSTVFERFRAKYDVDDDGCWVWSQATKKNYFYINGNNVGAHIASWLIHNGSISDGFWIKSKCDKDGCVNPDHLYEHRSVCSVDGCERKHNSHGFCTMHGKRIERHESLDLPLRENEKPCTVDGCENLRKYKGLCAKHIKRLRDTGSTDLLVREPPRCSVEGCGKPRSRQGLCQRHWRQTPGGQTKTIAATVKRKRAQADAFIEDVDKAVQWDRWGGLCYLCWESIIQLPLHSWHLEHIIPLSRGGEHSYRNTAPSCKLCNQSKNNKTFAEFVYWKERFTFYDSY